MNFHINSIESFSAHPDGHSCLEMFAVNGQWHTPTNHHQHNIATLSKNGRACMYCRQAAAPTVSIHTTGM